MNTQPSLPHRAVACGASPRRNAAVTPGRLRACADALSSGDPDRAEALLARLCDGLGPLDAGERVLAVTARTLGERWTDDTCDFATLTLAMGRLHALLRRTGRTRVSPRAAAWPPRRALLPAAPGEQHIFGAAMLAEAFRGAGWAVSAPQAATAGDLVREVRSGAFDVVALSLACDSGVDRLARLIAELRGGRRGPTPVVLVGGRPFLMRPELWREVGADGSAADCAGALALADGLSPHLSTAA